MSTVIKAGQAGSILKRLSHVDLADHLSEAQAVIAEAKRRAAQTIGKAKEESVRIREAAREEGFREGRAQGFQEGTEVGRREARDAATRTFEDAHADAVSAMESAVAEIESIKGDLAIRAEQNLLDFAIRIVEKLTYAVGRMDRESANANFGRALRLVDATTDIRVFVHPDDVETLQSFAPSVLQKSEQARGVEIVADEKMAPGGCRVMYGQFEVDQSLDTQIMEMVSLLLGGSRGE